MIKRRMTNQRHKILEHLKKVKTHPSAEMIYEEVIKVLPKTTLATVYRNLNILSDEGEILKLEVNSTYRFDGDVKNHLHFICITCGDINDSTDDKLSNYILRQIKGSGFYPKSLLVMIYGHCKSCRK